MATFIGNNRANTITGTSRDDDIFGLGGNDNLNGARGDDFVDGGTGNDRIQGGFGSDVLEGGAGSDRFRWDDFGTGDSFAARADVITDFARGDKIDLTAVDVFDFGGFGDSSPSEGEWSIWSEGRDQFVTWNTFGEFHDVEVQGKSVAVSDVIW